MEANPDSTGRLPAAFLTPGSSSFMDFLSEHRPDALPAERARALPVKGTVEVPHGTTIVALTYQGGVVMAGDRRATMGNVIAHREIEKVFPADEYSAVAFAGTAGFGVELVKLFQMEIEHFEKVEGATLSLEGKANRLSAMIRSNLSMAMQGLAVVPLFAGWDVDRGCGRIFTYDVTGGRTEERGFASTGSGSVYARGSMKKLFHAELTESDATTLAVQALYDAADDDSATGGPDMARRIFPLIAVIGADGYRRLTEEESSELARSVLERRLERPEGPRAELL